MLDKLTDIFISFIFNIYTRANREEIVALFNSEELLFKEVHSSRLKTNEILALVQRLIIMLQHCCDVYNEDRKHSVSTMAMLTNMQQVVDNLLTRVSSDLSFTEGIARIVANNTLLSIKDTSNKLLNEI